MSDPGLPPDLTAVERLLSDRPRVDPPAGLAPRVLAAARDELRARPAGDRRGDGWRSWAAVAAAALFGVNLSMSVSADTAWDFAGPADPTSVAAATSGLRALAPDLPESELRRQALLARAGATMTPALALDRSGDGRDPTREAGATPPGERP
jgi:hypothetical protein